MSSQCNANTNCWRRDATTGDTQTTHHKAKLRFAWQWRWQTDPQIQHKVTNYQYYARGNACMHQHHQAKVQDFSGQPGYPKIPVDMALQNGKLHSQQARWTTGILPPANPKTRATWTHSYGNKLGRLAQGMPSWVTWMDTIFFIPKDKDLRARAKNLTYSLITCLIRPEKTNEPNRTRLVAGETGYITHLMQAHQPPTYLLWSYSSTPWSPHPGQDSSQWTSRISTYVLLWRATSTCN